MSKTFTFVSPHGCSDCEFLAFDTEGMFDICPECEEEGLPSCTMEKVEDDDGQPDAMQEWHDFDPDCQGVVMNTFRIIMEMIRTVVPIAILVIQLMILQGFSL